MIEKKKFKLLPSGDALTKQKLFNLRNFFLLLPESIWPKTFLYKARKPAPAPTIDGRNRIPRLHWLGERTSDTPCVKKAKPNNRGVNEAEATQFSWVCCETDCPIFQAPLPYYPFSCLGY